VTGAVADDWAGRFENTSTDGFGILAKINSTSSGDYIFQARTGTTNVMTILGDGNVGISTDSPDSPLHLSQAAANTFFKMEAYASTQGADAGINVAREQVTGSDSNLSFWTNTGSALTQKMRIDSSGNVKIGNSTTGTPAVNADDLVIDKGASESGITLISTAAASIRFGDAANTSIGSVEYNHNSNYMRFSTNNAERIRIESTGVVKFPNTATSTGDVGTIAHYTNNYMYIRGGTSGLAIGDDGFGVSVYLNNSDSIQFNTGGTERMRITSGGTTEFKRNVDILSDQNTNMFKVRSTSGSFTSSVLLVDCDRTTTNNTYNLAAFTNAGTAKCVITDGGDLKNTNNSYGAISDERLKENITDATPKLDDLMKVKIRNYNLIGDDKKQIGVVAQELEEVFPNMIDESIDYEYKNIEDEDGNITEENIDLGTTTKSVKYSVFVPMLIKAIQELKAEIDDLKNKCNCK